MPITEVIRVLAVAESADGRRVELAYDVDGRLGFDEDARQQPSFWLRVDGVPQGPFESELDAVEAAGNLGVEF